MYIGFYNRNKIIYAIFKINFRELKTSISSIKINHYAE